MILFACLFLPDERNQSSAEMKRSTADVHRSKHVGAKKTSKWRGNGRDDCRKLQTNAAAARNYSVRNSDDGTREGRITANTKNVCDKRTTGGAEGLESEEGRRRRRRRRFSVLGSEGRWNDGDLTTTTTTRKCF